MSPAAKPSGSCFAKSRNTSSRVDWARAANARIASSGSIYRALPIYKDVSMPVLVFPSSFQMNLQQFKRCTVARLEIGAANVAFGSFATIPQCTKESGSPPITDISRQRLKHRRHQGRWPTVAVHHRHAGAPKHKAISPALSSDSPCAQATCSVAFRMTSPGFLRRSS